MRKRKPVVLPRPAAEYVAILREHATSIRNVPPGTWDTDTVQEMAADADRLEELADWLASRPPSGADDA